MEEFLLEGLKFRLTYCPVWTFVGLLPESLLIVILYGEKHLPFGWRRYVWLLVFIKLAYHHWKFIDRQTDRQIARQMDRWQMDRQID